MERTNFSHFGKNFQEALCLLILEDRPFADQLLEVFDITFLELGYLRDFHLKQSQDNVNKILKTSGPKGLAKKKPANTKKQTDPNLKKLEEPGSSERKLEKGGFSRQ